MLWHSSATLCTQSWFKQISNFPECRKPNPNMHLKSALDFNNLLPNKTLCYDNISPPGATFVSPLSQPKERSETSKYMSVGAHIRL